MSRARTPLCEVHTLSAGSAVRVAGRIVAREGDTALLADAEGSCPLSGPSLAPLDALTMVEGVWTGETVRVTQVLHAQACAPQDPRDSELWALTSGVRTKQHRLELRAQVFEHVRTYFRAEGFLELDTPLIVPSPGLDVHLSAMSVESSQGRAYLLTSPEYQMKRLLAGGLERIVQIGKCFRNDEVGERHQPEFTMLEWYRAWAGMDDVMRDTEQLVAHVARALSGGEAVLHTSQGPIDVTPPWPRLTVREAFARHCGLELDDVVHDEDRFYRELVERIEPALEGMGAVFLTEYPASMASLARKKPDDPRVAERFEAYVGGIELCNGFGELTDADEQRARFVHDQRERERLGLPVYPIDERFMAALEQGIPPSGGNALGLDRLVMLALGAAHIEDVLAIPRSRL
jgi:lysyl-tRNA synthetase class 2